METMHKDLAQATKVDTVSSDNNLFAEVGGSVVRFPVSNLLERVAGDSSGAAEALEKLSEAIENNPDIVEAILTPISKNSETTEKFDAEHQQFTVTGAIAKSTGNLSTSSTGWRTTCFIPLSLTHPLTAKFTNDSALGGIFFYDAQRQYISAVTHDTSLPTEITIQPEDYPNNAVFFRVSTPYASVSISYYTNGSTSESREGAIADVVAAAKKLLFIDEWLAFEYTDYQPKKAKPFIANEVEMTYEEALVVKRTATHTMVPQSYYGVADVRTNLNAGKNSGGFQPIDMYAKFAYCTKIEAVRLSSDNAPFYSHRYNSAFDGCTKLRKILGIIRTGSAKFDFNNAFSNCRSLESIKIHGLNADVSFKDSPLLSLESLSYMVTNAANTDTITITVHADVYAKLTDTSNTEWNAVLTAAAAKKISFATA